MQCQLPKKEGEGGSTRSLSLTHHATTASLFSLSLSPPRSPTLSPPPAAATPLSGNNDGLKFLNILRGGEAKEEGKTSFLRPAGRHEGQAASRRGSGGKEGGTSVPRFLFLNLDHVPACRRLPTLPDVYLIALHQNGHGDHRAHFAV